MVQQSLEDSSTHHSSIEYEAPTIKFQPLVEHFHLLEIYYYISFHTFSKENVSSLCTGSDSF
jgi:hypothetical protein